MEASNNTQHLPQVAVPSGTKRWGAIVFGVLVITMLAWTLWGGHKQAKSQVLPTLKPNWHLSDAEAHDSSGGVTSMDAFSQKLEEIKKKRELEKMAQQEKLYRMRQAAPIEMYTASSVGGAATLNSSTASSNMAMATSATTLNNNLPLSASQIEKLKNDMAARDPNSQFQQEVSKTPVETVDATRIEHPNYTITQGTLISGVLQTAINSDLPGMVKANVSIDVYASQGRRILIPKGSTLIGQYNSGISMGQRRVFVVWTRLIRPDGIDVMLGSPGTDALGQGGLGADALDTHFWARFGQASLLSIIGAGIANVGVDENDQFNSASAYRMTIANNFQQTANSALLTTMNIKPTIHVYQGEKINVFVNRDLAFYNVLAAPHD